MARNTACELSELRTQAAVKPLRLCYQSREASTLLAKDKGTPASKPEALFSYTINSTNTDTSPTGSSAKGGCGRTLWTTRTIQPASFMRQTISNY